MNKENKESQLKRDILLAEIATKEAIKRMEFENVDGFTIGMTPMVKERALIAINKIVSYHGSMHTIKDIVRQKVATGFYVEEDSDGMILTNGDLSQSAKQLTKTGLNYAKFLIAKHKA